MTMEKMFNTLSICIGVVFGLLAKLFGGYDGLLIALIVLIVLDYITGIIKAVCNKNLSSEVGFKGILKKIIVLIVVATANVVQSIVGENIPIREIVIMFFTANEGISILENASEFIPVPQKLKEILTQLRDRNGGDNNGD